VTEDSEKMYTASTEFRCSIQSHLPDINARRENVSVLPSDTVLSRANMGG
jgi:hypothetical protein